MTDERFEEILKSEEQCSLCLKGEDADYCSECSDCVPKTFEEIKEFWQMVHEINDFEKSQCAKFLAKLQQYERNEAEGRLIRPPGIMDWFKWLAMRADSALLNRDLNMVYQVYGEARMARMLGAITFEQFMEFNTKLVRNGINNPKAGLQ